MLKPCFAVEKSIFQAVGKAGLPAEIMLHEIDDDVDLAGLTAQAGTGNYAGSFLLGMILPPAGEPGDDMARAALLKLLPEMLQEGSVFNLSTRNQTALAAWCWQRVCMMSDYLLREYARSHLALAAARVRERRLEAALEAAEAAFTDFRKEPLKLALRLPATGVYAPPAAGARFILRQEIAVLLANVIYLDLFFNRDGAGLTGSGRLMVAAAYSGQLICDQKFEFIEISQGWQRFYCFSEALLDKQPLQITLELRGDPDADLMPGLSGPTPLPRESASIDGAGAIGRPLALQVWTGIAGIAYPRHVNALAPATVSPRPDNVRFSLPPDRLAAAQPYQVGRSGLDFAPVSYQSATQSLLVHPLGLTPTVARLAGIQVTRLKFVSALVQLDGPEAKPTDFAVLAISASERPPRFEDGRQRDHAANPGFSWLTLRQGEWGEATFTLDTSISGQADIYLLTKNHTAAYDLSWAFFRGVTLECRGS